MEIIVAVAEYHPGNTSDYVVIALRELGHEVTHVEKDSLYNLFFQYPEKKFFCVDSGGTFDFQDRRLLSHSFENIAFWMVDFRHNKHRIERSPTDFENATILNEKGGWIFQAQWEDVQYCHNAGIKRCSWLPVAADPNIWNNEPVTDAQYDLAFVGHVWDGNRASVLEQLLNAPDIKFALAKPGKLWKEQAASVVRAAKVGFNVNYYYGREEAYDLNMRVFETLSCGKPLITSDIDSLWRIFPKDAPYIRCYQNKEDVLPTVREALKDHKFLDSGNEARKFIMENGTYKNRMEAVLKHFEGRA